MVGQIDPEHRRVFPIDTRAAADLSEKRQLSYPVETVAQLGWVRFEQVEYDAPLVEHPSCLSVPPSVALRGFPVVALDVNGAHSRAVSQREGLLQCEVARDGLERLHRMPELQTRRKVLFYQIEH